jgi:hypothetical protein
MDGVNPEIAWAAGLFEGEGTITICGGSLHLRVQMTDLEVLERFCQIVGTGKIYGPYTTQFKDGFNRKPRWTWVCYGPLARATYLTLSPWLSPRRLARGDELGLRSM